MSIWSGSSGLHSILIIQSSLQMLCVCGFISGTLWRACLLYQELTTNLLTSNKGRWLLESSATCCSCAPGPRVVHTWRRKRGVQVAVPRREQSRGEQRRAEQRKAEHITAHQSSPGCRCRVPLVHQVELQPHKAQTTARLGAGSSASQLGPHSFLSGGGLSVLLGLMWFFYIVLPSPTRKLRLHTQHRYIQIFLKGGKGSINGLSYIPKSIFIAELQDQWLRIS